MLFVGWRQGWQRQWKGQGKGSISFAKSWASGKLPGSLSQTPLSVFSHGPTGIWDERHSLFGA